LPALDIRPALGLEQVMSFFRYAFLACALLGCSGSEDEPAGEETTPQGVGGMAGTPGTAGLPGIDAPPDVAGPPGDAEVTASGLASRRLVAGTGDRSPAATDTVRVHYTGWQTDGMRFDSSVTRGAPLDFALNEVIRGWTEGLQLMVEGETRRFWIPDTLAYRGVANRPQGTLVFDVQLLAILPK
jgi:FKBP-type peptidyl-prolyl cis-trans isomerase